MELAERLVEEGFLSYDDLSIIEPDNLMEMSSLNEAQVEKIVAQAEAKAEEAEAAAAAARRQKREDDRQAALKAEQEEAAESGQEIDADLGPAALDEDQRETPTPQGDALTAEPGATGVHEDGATEDGEDETEIRTDSEQVSAAKSTVGESTATEETG